MKDEYYKIMDIIFEKHKDRLSYEDCYDIARDIDEKIFSNRLTKLVSLQNADWQVIKKVGNPKETDRYLIAYRVNGMTHIKFFTADYDTHYGWSNILDDIEIMAYKKIEFDESILSN